MREEKSKALKKPRRGMTRATQKKERKRSYWERSWDAEKRSGRKEEKRLTKKLKNLSVGGCLGGAAGKK